MKTTGVIRQLDALGRIVLPIELRRTLEIGPKDMLEIFVEGNSVILYGAESHKTQHWFVVPVSQDHLGNNLYYKIVNYENTNLALTSGASGMTLETYSGADSQLWLLNADGLQGFAGYCKDDTTGQIKAADIGGLFGEVVEVTTFDDLKKYATSDTPYTIVVTKDLSVTDLNLNGLRLLAAGAQFLAGTGRCKGHGYWFGTAEGRLYFPVYKSDDLFFPVVHFFSLIYSTDLCSNVPMTSASLSTSSGNPKLTVRYFPGS